MKSCETCVWYKPKIDKTDLGECGFPLPACIAMAPRDDFEAIFDKDHARECGQTCPHHRYIGLGVVTI